MEEIKRRMLNCEIDQDRMLRKLWHEKKSTLFEYEKIRQIGYFQMLDIAGIDRKEFNWIFK